MPKVEYLGIKFDSELEVEYYKYLEDKYKRGFVLDFIYHPMQIPNLVGKRAYTPDFLVLYLDHIEIVETKGFNPYSKMIDDQIHNVMLSKNEKYLSGYVYTNIENAPQRFTRNEWWEFAELQRVSYKKIKYLKAYGFVDWDFKNPNTLANKRKEKINDLSAELKELKEFKKNTLRYWKLFYNGISGKKLTKAQNEFMSKYANVINEYLKEATSNNE